MEILIFKLIGALGIILISIGIISKKRKVQDTYYIAGGLCLEIYSIHIWDEIFMVLQLIFILAAVADFMKVIKEQKKIITKQKRRQKKSV